MDTLESNYTGRFNDSYQIHWSKYNGLDFTKVCFTFPGQNSSHPKMFQNLYAQNDELKRWFKEADTLAIKYNLPQLSLYITTPSMLSSEDHLLVKNIALFVVQVALGKMLIKKGITPSIVAGHSFGLFASLVVAESISFEEMFDFVVSRELYSPPQNSLGSMIVATPSDELTETLNEFEYYISNYNTKSQLAISIAAKDVSKALLALSGKGLRYSILSDVPHPYHSPLMRDLKNRLIEHLDQKNYNISAPTIPVASYVTNEILSEKNWSRDKIVHALVNHIEAPVDFVTTIQNIYGQKVPSFIEVGPRETCSKFIGSILETQEHSVVPLLKYFAVKSKKQKNFTVTTDNKKVFETLRKIVAKVTGYEVESINIQDRYQEDLNIDSIKKAEIYLEVAKEYQLTEYYTMQAGVEYDSIGESVELIVNYLKLNKNGNKNKKSSTYKDRFDRYFLGWTERSKINVPSELLPEFDLFSFTNNQQNLTSWAKSCFENNKKHLIINAITPETHDFSSEQVITLLEKQLLPFIHFIRDSIDSGVERTIHWTLVHNNEHNAIIRGLGSFLSAISGEIGLFFVKNIFLPEATSINQAMPIVLEEAAYPLDRDIKYQKGKRFAFAPIKAKSKKPQQEIFFKNVVVIGGAKGIAHLLLQKSETLATDNLYIIGRSDSNSPDTEKALTQLKKRFKNVEYIQGDATDSNALQALHSHVTTIDLFINAAGVEFSLLLKQKTTADIKAELETKVLSTANIIALAKQLPINRLISFSSHAAFYGRSGQAVYSAANTIMSSMAYDIKQSLPSICVQNIHWPAWDNMGMTAKKMISSMIRQTGVSLLDKKRGCRLFSNELANQTDSEIGYFDSFDPRLYQGLNNNLDFFSPLVGAKTPGNLTEYKKTFNLTDDAYLKDHKMQDEIVVPAATIISMISQIVHSQSGFFPKIDNLTCNSFIKIKEEGNTEYKIVALKNKKGMEFVVRDDVFDHYSCSANPFMPKKIRSVAIPKESEDSIYIDKEQIYKHTVSHTGVFQVLNQLIVSYDHSTITGIIHKKELENVFNLGIYNDLIFLGDGLFQTMGMMVALFFNKTSCPYRIDNFFYDERATLTEKLFVTHTAPIAGKDSVSSDLKLINEQGQVVISSNIEHKIIGEVQHNFRASLQALMKYKQVTNFDE